MTSFASASTSAAVFLATGCSAVTATSSFFSTFASSFTGLAFFLTGVLPPRRMLIRLRFIALHIICVSNKPEAPTIPPTATRKISLIAIPAIAPATPDRELSRDIVIGISAPPTRMEKNTPKRQEVTIHATTSTVMFVSHILASTKPTVSSRKIIV